MKLLIALLAAIGAAAVAGFIYWRRNPKAVNSVWTQATDATTSFTKSAADAAAEAATSAADAVKGAAH
jgi:hypothetical protein